MSVNANSHSKLTDKLVLLVGFIVFIVFTGGSIKEYRTYQRGLDEIKKAENNITDLQARKERLEKLLENTKQPEFVEKQLKDKLGLIKEGAEIVLVPTVEPKLIDLIIPDPPPRRFYWREWLELILRN